MVITLRALIASVSVGAILGCSPMVDPAGSEGEVGPAGTNSTPNPSIDTNDDGSSSAHESSASTESTTGPSGTAGTSAASTDPTSGSICYWTWPYDGCATFESTSVEGTAETPHGEFLITHAYFGSQTYCGFCVDESNVSVVYLLTEPAPADSYDLDAEQMLVLDLGEAFTGPFGAPVDGGTLESVRDGTSIETDAVSFQLDTPPPLETLSEPFNADSAQTISGNLEVETEGWQIDLVFEAGYCPAINTSYICE